MRIELTEELKQRFSEFFPYRGDSLSLFCDFQGHKSRLRADFAEFLDENSIDYIAYLTIQWGFKGHYIKSQQCLDDFLKFRH